MVLDVASISIVTSTIGLAQNAPSDDELVQNAHNKLWVQELLQVQVVLLSILGRNICDMSAYNVDQTEDRRSWEVSSIIESVLVGHLINSSGRRFKVPLWILWALNFSKCLQRIIYFESVNKSYGVGRNPILVANYMKYEHELSHPDQVDPVLVSGYKYLVLGEEKQKVEPHQMPPHVYMTMTVTRKDKLITLDKIWRCEGRLLSATGADADGELKDLCLSFAMYKLLRLRFKNMHRSPAPVHSKHGELFWKGLIPAGFQRAFRVAEVELAFLSDHFNTRYPIIFSRGLPILNVVISFSIGITCGFSIAPVFTAGSLEGQSQPITRGVKVGKVITLLLLIVVTLKELWEVITYILSDWTKVVPLCKYVEKPSWQKFKCVEKTFGCLCRLRIRKTWHGKIGQYSLLRSFNYKPWNLGYKLTWGLINVTPQGRTKCNPIRVSNAVMEAVLNSLILSNGQLTNGKSSLERNGMEISWTLEQDTRTHSILIWHIATSLCEIELLRKRKAKDRSLTRLEKYLKIPRSCATYLKNWWKPLPFYVNLENLQGNLQCPYEIAANLSRYCAYLVAFQQDLVSDSSLVVEYILNDAILKAREYFEGHGSMEIQYDKMMATGEKPSSETIVANGVKLGKQLIETIESDEIRWNVLAEFWAEWIMYMARSDDISAHESALANGGEFMTHLWALLAHAGIPEQPEAPYSAV